MEEQQQLSISKTAVKYGVIFGIVGIAYNLLANITQFSLDYQGINMTISTAIPIVLIIIALREFRAQQGYLSFRQGFSLGMLTSLIYSLLVSLFSYIYMKFIDPGMMNLIKERQVEEMEKRGYDEATIEQSMKTMEFMMSPETMLFISVLGGVIMMAILSLIIAAIMKKDNPQMI